MTSNQIQKLQNRPVLDYGSVTPENSKMMPSFTQSINIERRLLLENQICNTNNITVQGNAHLKDAMDNKVEHDINELIAPCGQEELEDLYDMLFIMSNQH